MDIPKKGVTMEDVNTARALHKARSGTEEEEETGLFISLYFSCILNHYHKNTYNTIVFQTLQEIYVFLCVTTIVTSSRSG